ncbi:hypothetical protein LTR70_004947 [Exophiala xenobiotica]|uniref:Uncharacterized protein n=1 Tax=Lithohypha guttulata TaxID=1690604 RepID=A0ABR0KBN6_9EURO|nr:hypothetical protein LTR24_004520 [Lithohypha guttulata]KAK5319763.1 hypothetical protein LTR70_004947 [Exophiala xenobiotica]
MSSQWVDWDPETLALTGDDLDNAIDLYNDTLGKKDGDAKEGPRDFETNFIDLTGEDDEDMNELREQPTGSRSNKRGHSEVFSMGGVANTVEGKDGLPAKRSKFHNNDSPSKGKSGSSQQLPALPNVSNASIIPQPMHNSYTNDATQEELKKAHTTSEQPSLSLTSPYPAINTKVQSDDPSHGSQRQGGPPQPYNPLSDRSVQQARQQPTQQPSLTAPHPTLNHHRQNTYTSYTQSTPAASRPPTYSAAPTPPIPGPPPPATIQLPPSLVNVEQTPHAPQAPPPIGPESKSSHHIRSHLGITDSGGQDIIRNVAWKLRNANLIKDDPKHNLAKLRYWVPRDQYDFRKQYGHDSQAHLKLVAWMDEMEKSEVEGVKREILELWATECRRN